MEETCTGVEDGANDDVSSANGVVGISNAVEEGARVDDGGAAAARVEVTASGVDEVGGAEVLDGGIGVELLRAIVDESAAGELVGGVAVINTCSEIYNNLSQSNILDSPNCTATRGTSLDAGVYMLISVMNTRGIFVTCK